MLKKAIFPTLALLTIISITAHADVLYCPQPTQITQEKMVNGYWLYEATIDGHAWAQFGGYTPAKGADATAFTHTTIFPHSAGYVGDMQCNYTAADGSPITLWSQVFIKPDWDFPGNAWMPSVLHNGIYPCNSTLIAACPAITVEIA